MSLKGSSHRPRAMVSAYDNRKDFFMKRNVLIIEDDKTCLEALAEMTRTCDAVGAVFCVDNSAEAYKYAMEEDIDLFLIDIVLDKSKPSDVSGIVFADTIRKQERYNFTPIIFITSLVDEQMNAFHKLHCFDYIEKPFDSEKVKQLIKRALMSPVSEDREKEVLYYKKDGVLFALNVDEIRYIETHLKTVTVYTVDEQIEIPYVTNRQLLKDLPRKYFIQCSRNAILNRKYIEYIDKANQIVKVRKGGQVNIGGKMRKRFFEEL